MINAILRVYDTNSHLVIKLNCMERSSLTSQNSFCFYFNLYKKRRELSSRLQFLIYFFKILLIFDFNCFFQSGEQYFFITFPKG